MGDIQLFNDHFQNFKQYGIPKAQLIIADIPYNIGKDEPQLIGGYLSVESAKEAAEKHFNELMEKLIKEVTE